jgi:outer membrane protein assembly factor BamA
VFRLNAPPVRISLSLSLWVFVFFGAPTAVQGQSLVVDTIIIQGNKRAKEKVIRREMSFSEGDSLFLQDTTDRFTWNRLQILNTGLFTQAEFKTSIHDSLLNLEIELEEAFPIVPVLNIEFADRNFNVWWEEFNRDLRRINYGVFFYHKNLTGVADFLKVVVQGGFTPKFEADYTLPQLGPNKVIGLKANFFYSTNRELGYITQNNLLVFERNNEGALIRRLRAGIGIRIRPRLKNHHSLNLFYRDRIISNQVSNQLNPDFLLNGQSRQQYFSLHYNWFWDNRDLRAYPSKGNYFSLTAEKLGIGLWNDINLAFAALEYGHFWSPSNKLILESRLKGRLSFFREQPPYYNYRAFGYGEDYLRGYELYVIDGLDFFYWKQSVHFQLLKYRFRPEKLISFLRVPSIPIRVYASLNSDLGYVHSPYFNETNDLGNQWLWGGGAGLDILLFYDRLFRLEYSFNELGEKGLFLHYKFGF